jgi:hypothetical protein
MTEHFLTQRPAYLGTNADTSAFASGLGVPQPPRISMDNDRFNLVLASGIRHPTIPASLSLDVVVIGANEHASRVFYGRGHYDPNNAAPPVCYSDNGSAPSANAIQPQSELCVNCRHSVWDQPTPNGNMVPACDTRKKLACIVGGAGDTVFLLSIAPASLGAWRDYVAYLAASQAGPFDVVTRLTYQDKKFKFETIGWLPQNFVAVVQKAMAGPEIAAVVNANDQPFKGALIGYDKPKQIEAPARAPMTFESGQPSPKQIEAPARAPMTFESGQPSPVQEASVAKNSSFVNASVPDPVPARRVRKPKETVVGAGPIPAATFAPPPASPTGFGMDVGATPPNDMQAALDRAFGTNFGAPSR